jgi:L-seryl-tRNA(Ser) seleniumtransferase
MPRAKAVSQNSVLRNLPSVDELLRTGIGCEIKQTAGEDHLTRLARVVVAELRGEIASSAKDFSKDELIAAAATRLKQAWFVEQMAGTRRVINATGVVIHTNLGRAPLSEAARQAIQAASGNCTLEYDLVTGKRGRRGARAEDLIIQLTGAEDALIVNNCAAAAFFVLTAFASGGEVIISRGEMVEIGGDFRVPDVLSQSGAALSEVGTTNRTKLADYEKAIGKKTRVILRVHPSNYRIIGFTAMPSLTDLAAIAKKHKVMLYEDIGSGAVSDLSALGLGDEPVVSRSIADGADVVTFSGDKLLGGPQAGIIAGRKAVIEKLRKHPLYRALRVDKLAYAALEATLEAHRRGSATEDVPVLKMLSMSRDEIAERANSFVKDLKRLVGKKSGLKCETVAGVSAIGGGAAPAVNPETTLIAVSHSKTPTPRLEQKLRLSTPPVIARIIDDRVMIDLRTVSDTEMKELLAAVADLA